MSRANEVTQKIDEAFLNEAPKKVKLSMGDQVDLNVKVKQGKIDSIKIDSNLYDWADKTFAKGSNVSITNKNKALDKQKIEISTPTKTTVITPFGDVLKVTVTSSTSNKPSSTFYKV